MAALCQPAPRPSLRLARSAHDPHDAHPHALLARGRSGAHAQLGPHLAAPLECLARRPPGGLREPQLKLGSSAGLELAHVRDERELPGLAPRAQGPRLAPRRWGKVCG